MGIPFDEGEDEKDEKEGAGDDAKKGAKAEAKK